MYKLFLTLRYLRTRRIAYFAVAAVLLCTAMVLVVMSVMGGFLDQLKSKARGLLGDIIVDNGSYGGFPLYEEFIADVAAWPEVVRATPVLYSWALLRFEDATQTNTVRVVGLRLNEVYEVNAFKEGLYYEKHYPGTTQLGDQQQPLLGFDAKKTIVLHDDQGQLIGEGPRPVLPPAYQEARERSKAAGVVDDDTADTELVGICRENGLTPLVGVYERAEGFGPPALVGDPRPGLIVGRNIIARRLADGRYERFYPFARGAIATLTLLPVANSGSVDTPIKQPFRYVDDSRTGIYEIDSQHVYCDFDLLQKLLRMDAAERVDPETGQTIGVIPARCSQIQIKIRERIHGRPVDAQAFAERLRNHYLSLVNDPRFKINARDKLLVGTVDALTWERSQKHIIAPLEKERQLVTILFAIISLVAGFLVLCILYMIVLQKSRDIGIVKAVGGSPVGLATIFVLYGAFIGVVGSVCGTIFGCYFVQHINELQDFLVRLNPAWQVWDRSVYSFDAIPNTVRAADAVVVMLAAIGASTLGALLAALRAGFQQPVEALRYE